MTEEELAAKWRAKYKSPAYDSIPDKELVGKILNKYPQYRAQLDFIPRNTAGQKIYPQEKPQSALSMAGQVAGEMNPLGPEATAFLAEEGAPVAGAMIGAKIGAGAGAALGTVALPGAGTVTGATAGAISGAALGGMAGKAYKKLADYLTGHADPANDSPMGNAGDIAGAGLAQALSEGTGQAIEKAAALSKPTLAKIGGQIMQATAGIPSKYGEAVLKNPAILFMAHLPEDMSKAYQAFERYTGLQGLGSKLVSQNRAHIPPVEAESLVVSTANKIFRGEKLTPQELYEASQTASHIKLAASVQDPAAQQMLKSGIIKQSKEMIDGALEQVYPEYKNLRVSNFMSKARKAFSTVLPLNKNFTPSVVRYGTAMGAAGYELEQGHPGRAAMIAGAISPAAVGMSIRAASVLGPVVVGAAGVAGRLEAQNIADHLGAAPNPAEHSPEAQRIMGTAP